MAPHDPAAGCADREGAPTMRAMCEQCGAGHHIRDELVQPDRAFRFACRTCGEPVVIAPGPPPEKVETSPGFDTSLTPSALSRVEEAEQPPQPPPALQ